MKNYEPNGTTEDIKTGILHSINGYYVSNEGTKKNPNYHVWIPGITHASCDSAYPFIDLAVARCNYLAKNRVKCPTNKWLNDFKTYRHGNITNSNTDIRS